MFCVTGGVTKGSFYGLLLFKHFLASLWPTITLGVSTLKNQLNTPGQENQVSAGRKLQLPPTV
jgi:hypothetical protein